MLRIVAFAKAVAELAADGFRLADAERLENRLTICESCQSRNGLKCGECGCFVAVKARGMAWDCPHPAGSRWPKVDAGIENK